jgi:hypothetical protein
MRYFSRALLAGGLGFAVSFIAGCGGGAGLLPAGPANALNSQLDRISAAIAAGNCAAARSDAQALISQEASLPSTVNSSLRADLNNGVSTVSQDLQNCHATTATTTTPTTTATTTATTSTTTTPTTATTPPSTTTAPATTPTPTGTTSTPTSGGGGLSGGAGGGGQGLGNGNG